MSTQILISIALFCSNFDGNLLGHSYYVKERCQRDIIICYSTNNKYYGDEKHLTDCVKTYMDKETE